MSDFATIISAPFFIRALVGGLAAAWLTATLGVHVVMRRNSLFGEAISHAALAGVALGLWLQIDPLATTLLVAIAAGILLPYLEKGSRLPLDNWLGSLLPTAMGLGVILLALRPGYQPDLVSYLFGSILTISQLKLYWLLGLTVVTLGLTYRYRQSLLLVSFDETLAKVSGAPVRRLQLLFNILLAIAVTAGIQVVGAVLVNTLLIVPAAIVRLWAGNTRQMFQWTPLVASLLVVGGLLISAAANIPSGPTVAVLGGIVLLLSNWLRPNT